MIENLEMRVFQHLKVAAPRQFRMLRQHVHLRPTRKRVEDSLIANHRERSRAAGSGRWGLNGLRAMSLFDDLGIDADGE